MYYLYLKLNAERAKFEFHSAGAGWLEVCWERRKRIGKKVVREERQTNKLQERKENYRITRGASPNFWKNMQLNEIDRMHEENSAY